MSELLLWLVAVADLLRGARVRRARGARPAAPSRNLPGPGARVLPRRRLPARGCLAIASGAVRARARTGLGPRQPVLLGRRIRGRPGPPPRPRCGGDPRGRARRRLRCRAVRRPSADVRDADAVARRHPGGAPRRRRHRRRTGAVTRPAVRRRPEPTPQRAAVPGAVDRGDPERSRARHRRRPAVLTDRARHVPPRSRR